PKERSDVCRYSNTSVRDVIKDLRSWFKDRLPRLNARHAVAPGSINNSRSLRRGRRRPRLKPTLSRDPAALAVIREDPARAQSTEKLTIIQQEGSYESE